MENLELECGPKQSNLLIESLNNPSQRRTGDKQTKKLAQLKKLCNEKLKKNPPMVPPLDHFQGKKAHSSLARTISASRR